MTIEQLEKRSKELQDSITSITNQVLILQGHKNEVDYQLSLLINKPDEEEVVIEEDAHVE